jgi:hypothetical protein
MRLYFFLVILLLLPVSCDNNTENKIRKEVLAIAEEYVTGNLNDTTKKVMDNGIMIIGDDQKMYVIDPANIFTGRMDSDKEEDAIISLFPFQRNIQVTTEHLVIINISGRLTLIRTLESDMKILSIDEGVITAEVPEHSRNSPLFDCPSCQEVVRYRFVNGELERIDE